MLTAFCPSVRLLLLIAVLMMAKRMKASASIYDEVVAMGNVVNEATSPLSNSIQGLFLISQSSADWLKVLGPVGAFVAVATKTAFGPDSPELKALKLLQKNNQIQFERVSSQIIDLKYAIQNDRMLEDFTKEVGDNYAFINLHYNEVISESPPSTKTVEEFKGVCLDYNRGTRHIFNYLKRRTVANCRMDCPALPMVWAELNSLITTLMTKMNYWSGWNEKLFQAAAHELKLKLSGSACNPKIVKIIEQMHESVRSAQCCRSMEEVLSLLENIQPSWLKDVDPGKPGCILQAAILASGYDREYMQSVVDIIRISLEDVSKIAMLCSNTAYESDKKIQREQQLIIQWRTEIGDFSYHYAVNMLNRYWPTVAVESAKTVIKSYALHTDFPFEVSVKIKTILDAKGYDAMSHQIAVSKSYKKPLGFHVGLCDPDYCDQSIYLFDGYNAILSRTNQTHMRLKAARSKAWIEAQRERITEMIEFVTQRKSFTFSENYDIGELKPLVEEIISQTNASSVFNTMVMLRNWKVGTVHLSVSTAGSWELEWNAWQRITYRYDAPFWRPTKASEKYEALFFI